MSSQRRRLPSLARTALTELTEAAQGTTDLMPPIIQALKAYATLGEICGALRTVFGDDQPPTAVCFRLEPPVSWHVDPGPYCDLDRPTGCDAARRSRVFGGSRRSGKCRRDGL